LILIAIELFFVYSCESHSVTGGRGRVLGNFLYNSTKFR